MHLTIVLLLDEGNKERDRKGFKTVTDGTTSKEQHHFKWIIFIVKV